MSYLFFLVFIAIVAGFSILRWGKDKHAEMGVALLFFGFTTGIVLYVIDTFFNDDETEYVYENEQHKDIKGPNPSFHANKKGKPCHYVEYGSGDVRECSKKGKCKGGFDPSNRDPFKCANCGDHEREHY